MGNPDVDQRSEQPSLAITYFTACPSGSPFLSGVNDFLDRLLDRHGYTSDAQGNAAQTALCMQKSFRKDGGAACGGRSCLALAYSLANIGETHGTVRSGPSLPAKERYIVQIAELVGVVADTLKDFDNEGPVHKTFQPGIGPFGEPQLIKEVALRLTNQGFPARTHRTPDLDIGNTWAVEFKIVRPFGDDGRLAESWSQNLLHPYVGNTSLIGDALKLMSMKGYRHSCLFAICYEHEIPLVDLEPLLCSFELIAGSVMQIPLSGRVEERRGALVHPTHQVLRCVAWELTDSTSG